MYYLRKSEERGQADFTWLKSYHSFSFGEYWDPKHQGFGPLVVINQDWVAPDQGFPMHPHKNMEIFTYVIEGEIEHKDNLGNQKVSRAGEIQKMTAGTGIVHSEFNPNSQSTLHLLQIWITPNQNNLKPSYSQFDTSSLKEPNQLHLLLAPHPNPSPLNIAQDAFIYSGQFLNYQMDYKSIRTIDAKRHYWVQMISGTLIVNNQTLNSGDGLGIHNENELVLAAPTTAHFLLFDMT